MRLPCIQGCISWKDNDATIHSALSTKEFARDGAKRGRNEHFLEIRDRGRDYWWHGPCGHGKRTYIRIVLNKPLYHEGRITRGG